MRAIRFAERAGDYRDQVDSLVKIMRDTSEEMLVLVPPPPLSGLPPSKVYEEASRIAKGIAKRIVSAGFAASSMDSDGLIVMERSGEAWQVYAQALATAVKMRKKLFDRTVVLSLGFGTSPRGELMRLSDESNDYIAATIANALEARELILSTDTGGIPSADPGFVPEAFTIESLGYAEALEMTHFGARYIDPRALSRAQAAGMRVRLAPPGNLISTGTCIEKNPKDGSYPVRGLASIPEIALLSLKGAGLPGVAGIAARMFGALGKSHVNVILITQASSELSICCAIAPEDSSKGAVALEREFSSEIASGLIENPTIEQGLCVIAVVGESMKRRTGIAARVFASLGRNGVNVVAIAQGSSELNISVVIAQRDRAKALCALHDAFFLAGLRTVNLYLAGTGLIGSTLLAQIADQKNRLYRDASIRIRLAGIMDSKRMLVDPEGIDALAWRAELAEKGVRSDLGEFIGKMKSHNLPSSCFCDCTASDLVPDRYQDILEQAIAVVTPNKRGNSGARERYATLKRISREKDVLYGYETTVGAGLPVIGTLRDLVACGDTVEKIEAVLSGTISFIFNTLGGGESFSSLVRRAKSLGYTEPDPRDDLGAIDIARKALILAREAGMDIEFNQIAIEALVPPELMEVDDVGQFMERLTEVDSHYAKKISEAATEGKVLRYVACIGNGKASLKLSTFGPESAFYNLSGTDNLVMFSTRRYCDNPLVVRGPGAGAAVTAGGVFAEILKTAQSYL